MQNLTLQTTSYSHPDIESYISNLQLELTETAEIQAREDSARNSVLTEDLFNIKIKDFFYGRVQQAIDHIKNTLLVASRILDAGELDQEANKKGLSINNEVSDRLHTLSALRRKLKTLVIDPLKKKYGRMLNRVAILVGIADASLVFGTLRHGSYSVLQALIFATATGGVIATSHLAFTKWINRAKTLMQRRIRIFTILAIALLFFSAIGNIRASALNSNVDISLNDSTVRAVSNPHISGWTIALISWTLFAAIFFLSLLLWKTKEERFNEQEYDKVLGEISIVEAQVEQLKKEKEEIEYNALVQKSQARVAYDYAVRSITKVKNIGLGAIVKYKQVYVRFTNDTVPAFFTNPSDLVYDESFKFPHPEKLNVYEN